eukprot:TRINITY_DN15009_c0_g1_i1.p1 TRINITY_DN15009_c0_g1~~TRINITY_DN15009_c0_g1_i1.p1  ORF type:complete len:475 (+),score=123.79 TRINITY_DN15009_c0_g1_i1:180-1604(+)
MGDLLGSRVFVFTPKGEVRSLPKGATVIDYAYLIHTGVGNGMVAAKVNGNLVSPTHALANAEVVEVLTYDATHGGGRASSSRSKKSFALHQQWLPFAKTRSARHKLTKFLKEQAAILAADLTADKLEDFLAGLPSSSSDDEAEQGPPQRGGTETNGAAHDRQQQSQWGELSESSSLSRKGKEERLPTELKDRTKSTSGNSSSNHVSLDEVFRIEELDRQESQNGAASASPSPLPSPSPSPWTFWPPAGDAEVGEGTDRQGGGAQEAGSSSAPQRTYPPLPPFWGEMGSVNGNEPNRREDQRGRSRGTEAADEKRWRGELVFAGIRDLEDDERWQLPDLTKLGAAAPTALKADAVVAQFSRWVDQTIWQWHHSAQGRAAVQWLSVHCVDRSGILADISGILTEEGLLICCHSGKSEQGVGVMLFQVEGVLPEDVSGVCQRLAAVEGVLAFACGCSWPPSPAPHQRHQRNHRRRRP